MSAISIEFGHTRPHVTLNLFRSPEPLFIVEQVLARLDALATTLSVIPTHPYQDQRHVVPLDRRVDSDITSCGAWYTVEKRPTWLREDLSPDSSQPLQSVNVVSQTSPATEKILDVANHLIVLMVYRNFLAVYASQDTMRSRLSELIEIGEAGDDTRTIKIDRVAEVVRREELEQAFVRGNTKSAWLEGLHMPTVLKADRKILSGPDLRYALDHFGEQTFTYTAAISEFGQRTAKAAINGAKPTAYRVGVSHSKGTLWTKSTRTFDEFTDEFRLLVGLLTKPLPVPNDASEIEQAGVPFVARPMTTGTLDALSDGFDIGYEAPANAELELLKGEVTVSESKPDEWRTHGRFVVEEATKRSGAPKSEIAAVAYYDDRKIATVSFRPIRRTDHAVDILHRVESYNVRKDDGDLVALDRSLAKRNTNLTLRYGSGHVVQNGVLYTQQFRDVIFDRWRWMKFPPAPDGKPYILKDEKPTKAVGKSKVFVPDRIGLNRSLFCYVRNNASEIVSPDEQPSNNWWLLCDDGSGEIADFIALDTKALFVTFIHVKAWKDGSKNSISVTPFSEVVAQAIKNLRSFDQSLLAKEIGQRTTDRNSKLVWRADGVTIERPAFVAKLEELRYGAQRHVLILQPRIHRNAWLKAVHLHRAGENGGEVGRMRQLSALLSGAESTFQKLGATVSVVGVDDQTSAGSSAASRSSISALKPSSAKKRRLKAKR